MRVAKKRVANTPPIHKFVFHFFLQDKKCFQKLFSSLQHKRVHVKRSEKRQRKARVLLTSLERRQEICNLKCKSCKKNFFVTPIRFTSAQFPLRATPRRIFENACNTKIAPSLSGFRQNTEIRFFHRWRFFGFGSCR